VIGHIGELHPRWVNKEYGLPAAPVMFEIEAEPVQSAPSPVMPRCHITADHPGSRLGGAGRPAQCRPPGDP